IVTLTIGAAGTGTGAVNLETLGDPGSIDDAALYAALTNGVPLPDEIPDPTPGSVNPLDEMA
ncbi:MAG: hypothetical protein AAGB07_20685, partial [Pseudomonadota bacterium]